MFNLKKKNCLGNKKSLSLMSSIVALCFKKKKVAVQAPFRHRYRFKSIGLAPVSEKTQTIPIPSVHIKLQSPLTHRDMHTSIKENTKAGMENNK